MKNRLLPPLVLLFIVQLHAYSQSKYSVLSDTVHHKDSNTLFLHADFMHFLRNTEYFNPIVEGYTLIGATSRVGFQYNASRNTSVYAGVEAISFWGSEPFHNILPDLGVSYSNPKGLKITMGSLPHAHERQTVTMIANNERVFYRTRDRGIDLLLVKKRFNSNMWLAWQQFLLPGSRSQEMFVIGQNTELKLLRIKDLDISIPLQFTVHHQGGQINASFMPVKMIYNNAAGIRMTIKTTGGSLATEYHYVGHKLASRESDIPYRNGMGHYAKLTYNSRHLYAGAGYWQAFQYFSPEGEPIFMSVSTRIPPEDPPSHQPHRQLLHNELYYKTHVARGLTLLSGIEVLYDIRNSLIDYNYTLTIRWSDDFKLWTRK